jgi:hypothetical protein
LLVLFRRTLTTPGAFQDLGQLLPKGGIVLPLHGKLVQLGLLFIVSLYG